MSTLWAVADLHAAVKANAERVEAIAPEDPSDWLIVAGDVAERTDLVLKVLGQLARKFAQVIWVPGNHELFSKSTDRFRGLDKYHELVDGCRRLGVLTPEDPYPSFGGITLVPLFTLYDYSFHAAGITMEDALARAHERELVMTDEYTIAPFVDIRAWCWDRLAYSIRRLSKIDGPTILINHWPLSQEPTGKMQFADLALWCGTRHTRGWAERYQAQAVVYGHLHMPGVTTIAGVPHIEVSLGYPREWRHYGESFRWPYPLLRLGPDGLPAGGVNTAALVDPAAVTRYRDRVPEKSLRERGGEAGRA